MNTTEQALKQSIKDIETVLRIEGMDLEIGSRKLLREVIASLGSALAQPSQEPVEGELKRITHERDTLAEAIRDAAVSAGICRADAHLTGPHLLMLCSDMANCITTHDPQPSAPVAQEGRHVLTDADRETVLGLIAWLRGAAQGDRPNTTRGEAADTLQRILSTAPQVEQVEAKEGLQTQDAAINDFVEGYEMDSGEGIYMPTEHERFLINDAIRTFLEDQDWYMTAAPSSQKEGEQG